MRKLFTIENATYAVLGTGLLIVVLATHGYFDGPPTGVVYGKHTVPPTKHCSVQYGKTKSDWRIQRPGWDDSAGLPAFSAQETAVCAAVS